MRPPRFWTMLLTLCAPQNARETVLGDFHEAYAEVIRDSSEPHANAWYRRQVLASIPVLLFADRGVRRESGWRGVGSLLLGTIVALGCLLCIGGFAYGPFRETLFEHGAFGFRAIFWLNVGATVVAAVVAGWVTSMLARRSNLSVGFTLSALWWALVFISIVLRPEQARDGDWIILAAATLGAVTGVACRIAWLTRGMRAIR